MQSRVEVVNGMIAIVPAILIVHIIDAVEHTAEVSVGVALVDEGMLGPVAHHHNEPCIEHGYDEDHEGCFEVDKTHGDAEEIKHPFSKR